MPGEHLDCSERLCGGWSVLSVSSLSSGCSGAKEGLMQPASLMLWTAWQHAQEDCSPPPSLKIQGTETWAVIKSYPKEGATGQFGMSV